MTENAEGNMAIIFVIGSKPEANWPELEPDFIYTANGALSRVQPWVGRAKIIALFNKYFFKRHLKPWESSTARVVDGCKADTIIISGGARSAAGFVTPSQRGLTCAGSERLTRAQSFQLKLKFSPVELLFKEIQKFFSSPWHYVSLLKKNVNCRNFLARQGCWLC